MWINGIFRHNELIWYIDLVELIIEINFERVLGVCKYVLKLDHLKLACHVTTSNVFHRDEARLPCHDATLGFGRYDKTYSVCCVTMRNP